MLAQYSANFTRKTHSLTILQVAFANIFTSLKMSAPQLQHNFSKLTTAVDGQAKAAVIGHGKVRFGISSDSSSDNSENVQKHHNRRKPDESQPKNIPPIGALTLPNFHEVHVASEPSVHSVAEMQEIKMSSAIKDRTEGFSRSVTSAGVTDNRSLTSLSDKGVDRQPLLTMLEKQAVSKGKTLIHQRTESPVTRWKRHKNQIINIGFAAVFVSCLFLFSALALVIVHMITTVKDGDHATEDARDIATTNAFVASIRSKSGS